MSLVYDFHEKFKTKELKIYETENWTWSLRPHQVTIGSGILSLKRQCSSFGELELEEFGDLKNIIKIIENTLKELLNFDIMNYLMLMMVDKQVHFHVIPRYSNEVIFLNEIWKDNFWPGIPNLSGDTIDMNKLISISTCIKKNLKK
jgi:diadenosine tetraphosphate (Ap4A) HIT family hydrolase